MPSLNWRTRNAIGGPVYSSRRSVSSRWNARDILLYVSFVRTVGWSARKSSTLPKYVIERLTASPGRPVRETFVNVLDQP